ncbi:SDR family NAD(P)-dependent oxidoreductase [Thauera humireducens]|uniref:Short-chain dehydrogenase n=1 Tax=Thauera humireducens TaxID=1134435 RepID=A0A127K932_9RHOO|nr:SDR family oxidoreductase [Thauera humireducens]AMO38488.1 short-chain dehydrogenase [Thauera humireducens]
MRALITGASRGIGAAIALQLTRDARAAGQTVRLAIGATHPGEHLANLLSELKSLGADAAAVLGDLSDPAVPARLVSEAEEFCGGLDALVCNAGILGPSSLAQLDIDSWDRLFAVNTRATWLLAQAAYPALKNSCGAMVAVASMAGMQAHPNSGAYSSSKAAMIMLCQQLALEWAADGIRVNSLSPGMVHTTLTDRLYQNADVAARRKAIVPLHRIGQPEDIAHTVAFLLSPGATYITGQNICVDGGFTHSLMSTIPGMPKTD